jgi:hypothetical protein
LGSQTNRYGNSRQFDTGDMLLTAAVNTTCYSYGKKSHMDNKCPNREGDNNGNKRSSKRCLNFSKKEHLAKGCCFKESNKDKHPLNLKTKHRGNDQNEEIVAGIDDVHNLQEYLLGTFDKEDIIKIQTRG